MHVLVVLIVLFINSYSFASLKPVSSNLVKSLRYQYYKASPTLRFAIINKWNCQLYGVKSRMQTLKKAEFYDFSPINSKQYNNKGAHAVKRYTFAPQGLWGKNKSLHEAIRQLPDGRLISEFSIPIRKSKKKQILKSLAFRNHEVISYSVCSKI